MMQSLSFYFNFKTISWNTENQTRVQVCSKQMAPFSLQTTALLSQNRGSSASLPGQQFSKCGFTRAHPNLLNLEAQRWEPGTYA
jgi:hypothetical protein